MKVTSVEFIIVVAYSSIATAAIGIKDKYFNTSLAELVTGDGYPLESHYVITDDGCILNVHRMPYGLSGRKDNRVAYLQHGILGSSSDWILNGPGGALAYMLADEGCDVWIGNSRGNTFSRSHTVLDPDTESRFWQFSWHEVGVVDIPATIDFVLAHTGAEGVYYAGRSQGITTFYVMMSSKPEYNSKVKANVGLAPIAYISHVTSPLLRIPAYWWNEIAELLDIIKFYEFMPSQGSVSLFKDDIYTGKIGLALCFNVFRALCGFSSKQLNITKIPLIMEYFPAGSSAKQLLHYGQEIYSGKFRQYDYGIIVNLMKYGSMQPLSYDLGKITTPSYLIYSKNDWLVATRDVDKLFNELGGPKAKFLVSDYTFNHLDFIYGIDAPELVYSKVISLFSRH